MKLTLSLVGTSFVLALVPIMGAGANPTPVLVNTTSSINETVVVGEGSPPLDLDLATTLDVNKTAGVIEDSPLPLNLDPAAALDINKAILGLSNETIIGNTTIDWKALMVGNPISPDRNPFDPPPGHVTCHQNKEPWDKLADTHRIEEQLYWLVTQGTCGVPADSHSRVSCKWNSGIWLFNFEEDTEVQLPCFLVAYYGAEIVKNCRTDSHIGEHYVNGLMDVDFPVTGRDGKPIRAKIGLAIAKTGC